MKGSTKFYTSLVIIGFGFILHLTIAKWPLLPLLDRAFIATFIILCGLAYSGIVLLLVEEGKMHPIASPYHVVKYIFAKINKALDIIFD